MSFSSALADVRVSSRTGRTDPRVFALALATAAIGVIECKRELQPATPPAPVVLEVRVAGDEGLVDESAVRALLAGRGKLRTSGEGEPYRARVKVTSAASGGKITAEVDLTIEETKLGGRQIKQSAAAELPADHTTKSALAARLLGDVIEETGARLRLYYEVPSGVVVGLGSASREVQLEAVDVCGERKLGACTDPLIAMVRKDDLELRDRAVGALGKIGDKRAVRPLTEVSKFGELDELPKILDAVAQIGGAEARAYLEFVAAGHDRKEMRELAKKQIERLAP